MIELNLTRKDFYRFFRKEVPVGKNPHRRPFHSLPTDSAPHSKKNAPKVFTFRAFFWPVQRPNPYSASPSIFIYNLLQEFLQC